jgi:hypothetical protein
MLTTTPDKVRWIDTVRDCGRAFAAGEGVLSGEGVYVCDAKDGAAVWSAILRRRPPWLRPTT